MAFNGKVHSLIYKLKAEAQLERKAMQNFANY